MRWGVRQAAATYLVGVLLSGALGAAARAGATTSVWTHLAGVSGLWIALIGGALWASSALGTGRITRDFGFFIAPKDVAVGVTAGVVLQLVAVRLVSWPLEHVWDVDIEKPARELFEASGPRWLLVVLVVVGAPIVEELFFRGLLLRSVARHVDDLPAIVITSALFAGTHFQLAQFPGLFVVGVGLASLTRWSGRLGPAIVAHVAFNATAVWMIT